LRLLRERMEHLNRASNVSYVEQAVGSCFIAQADLANACTNGTDRVPRVYIQKCEAMQLLYCGPPVIAEGPTFQLARFG